MAWSKMMRFLIGLCCFASLAMLGCGGSSEQVAVYPVSGQIVYDGKPAEGVQVFLIPTSAPMVPKIPNNPNGITGADGRFKLSTYGENDGAAEGGYQIVLSWPLATKDDEESTKDRLWGWFDGAHTKLKFDVKTGSNEIPPILIRAITGPPEELKGIPGKN